MGLMNVFKSVTADMANGFMFVGAVVDGVASGVGAMGASEDFSKGFDEAMDRYVDRSDFVNNWANEGNEARKQAQENMSDALSELAEETAEAEDESLGDKIKNAGEVAAVSYVGAVTGALGDIFDTNENYNKAVDEGNTAAMGIQAGVDGAKLGAAIMAAKGIEAAVAPGTQGAILLNNGKEAIIQHGPAAAAKVKGALGFVGNGAAGVGKAALNIYKIPYVGGAAGLATLYGVELGSRKVTLMCPDETGVSHEEGLKKAFENGTFEEYMQEHNIGLLDTTLSAVSELPVVGGLSGAYKGMLTKEMADNTSRNLSEEADQKLANGNMTTEEHEQRRNDIEQKRVEANEAGDKITQTATAKIIPDPVKALAARATMTTGGSFIAANANMAVDAVKEVVSEKVMGVEYDSLQEKNNTASSAELRHKLQVDTMKSSAETFYDYQSDKRIDGTMLGKSKEEYEAKMASIANIETQFAQADNAVNTQEDEMSC